MQLYTCEAVSNLIEQYVNLGGEVIEISEGTLGYGQLILIASGYKTAIVTEVALNCWSSAHKIRMYNKIPAKYQSYI